MVQHQIVPVQAGATYMLSVSIRVGFGTISLKSDSLKSEAIAQALRENGVKSKDTLPIFEAIKNGKKFSLTQAGTALSTMLDRLQSRYMICSGSKRWWFVAEGDIAAVKLGIEDMEVERSRLLSELQGVYEQAKELFHERLTNILTTANRLDEFEAYERKFPAWREIEQEFRIEVDGPVRVPSVTDLAKQEPDMQIWMRNIHQQMQRDLPKLIDDACGTAAEFLSKLEQWDAANLTHTQAEKLAKGHERLESLLRLHDSICGDLSSTDAPVRSLISLVLRAADHSKTLMTASDLSGQYLLNLRQTLKDNEVLGGAGKGAKALYEWVHGASVEQKIKTLVQELKQFQAELPNLSQVERQSRLEQLKHQVENQTGVMSHAATNLLALLNNLLAASQPKPVELVGTDEIASEPELDSSSDLEMLEVGF